MSRAQRFKKHFLRIESQKRETSRNNLQYQCTNIDVLQNLRPYRRLFVPPVLAETAEKYLSIIFTLVVFLLLSLMLSPLVERKTRSNALRTCSSWTGLATGDAWTTARTHRNSWTCVSWRSESRRKKVARFQRMRRSRTAARLRLRNIMSWTSRDGSYFRCTGAGRCWLGKESRSTWINNDALTQVKTKECLSPSLPVVDWTVGVVKAKQNNIQIERSISKWINIILSYCSSCSSFVKPIHLHSMIVLMHPVIEFCRQLRSWVGLVSVSHYERTLNRWRIRWNRFLTLSLCVISVHPYWLMNAYLMNCSFHPEWKYSEMSFNDNDERKRSATYEESLLFRRVQGRKQSIGKKRKLVTKESERFSGDGTRIGIGIG